MTLADTAPNITRSNELINNDTAYTEVKILKKTQRNKMNSHNIGCMCYLKQTMQQLINGQYYPHQLPYIIISTVVTGHL